ncbi:MULTISPECIES: flavin reductase family protein [unclassified Variovorax]|uniref:flavin reductase family protein n=1 Tax=unclassified Variovorax TaxID=663243 RepID=UPI001BD37EDC|nr:MULTISPECIES: flavin reductase family protein [unclassified Variovorax]
MSESSITWLAADPPFTLLAEHDGESAGMLRKAYGCFPTGVVAVCALCDGQPVGMAASSFVPVSIDPPLLSFCVQWTSNTWARLSKSTRLGISFLGASHDAAARKLASRAEDKFDGFGLGATPGGAVLVDGAVVWIECSVESVVPAGDHGIVLLRIIALTMRPHVEPLVFHGSTFRQLQTAMPLSSRAHA